MSHYTTLKRLARDKRKALVASSIQSILRCNRYKSNEILYPGWVLPSSHRRKLNYLRSGKFEGPHVGGDERTEMEKLTVLVQLIPL